MIFAIFMLVGTMPDDIEIFTIWAWGLMIILDACLAIVTSMLS